MTANNQNPNAGEAEQTRHLVLGDVEGATAKPDAQAYYNQSWAVVIGINDYQDQHPRLANAKNDAEAVAHTLKETYGFEHVFTFYDQEATRDAIMGWLLDELPARVGPNDRAVFFFAGHGTTRASDQGDKRGYLIPQDAQRGRYSDYVDMAELREACKYIPAKHILIILDCCFSGVAAVAARAAPPMPPKLLTDVYLQRITEQNAWQVLTAGASDELAADSGTRPGHSAFTSALLAGLEGQADENGDGIITASELANFVKPEVTRDTFGAHLKGQTPFFNYLAGSGQGDFVFLRPGEAIKIQPASVVQREMQPLLEKYPWLLAVGAVLLAVIAMLAWFAWKGTQASRTVEERLAAMAATATQSAVDAQAALTAVANAPGPTQTAISVQQTADASKNATVWAATLTAIAAMGTPQPSPTSTPTATPPATPTSGQTPSATVFECLVTEQIGAVYLRDGPGSSFPLLGYLYPGDVVRVLAWADPVGQAGGAWFQVTTSDKRDGWIISRPYPELGRDYDCNFDPTQPFPFARAIAVPTAMPTPVAVLIATSGPWMDRTEVTNRQYHECVQNGPCTENASGYNALFYQDTYPVVGVNWQQAKTYCEWRGGRLPTAEEWQRAVSPNGQEYPWGDAYPSCNLAVTRDCGEPHQPLAVGSKAAGATSEGILDLIGNVWEWTATKGTGKDDIYVVLGGSWDNPDGTEKGGVENYNPKDSNLILAQGKDYQRDNQGFRCVYDSAPGVP